MSRVFANKARGYFQQGNFCSEAIPRALADTYGLEYDGLGKGASLLGGGLCNRGLTCGTLLGGLLALGLASSSSDVNDKPSRRSARAEGSELIDWFIARYGSTTCKEIISLDLTKPEDGLKYKQDGAFEFCCLMVEDCCRWLEGSTVIEDFAPQE